MAMTMTDLEQMPDLPGGVYTINTGQALMVWYDSDGNRHINGLGVRID